MLCTLLTLTVAVLSPVQQQSAELKLKLREDETVKYRHILNVSTFNPQEVSERVASSQLAFTFGEKSDGRIPVSVQVEEYEGLDQGTNNSAAGMKQVEIWFDIDNHGNTGKVEHKVPQPGIQPFGNIMSRSLSGMMSMGFLGWTIPEGKIPTGHTWKKTVSATDFLEMIFSPAGNAFDPFGDLEGTFTLIEIISVNKKPHARVSLTVTGNVNIDLHFPDNELSSEMTVDYNTSFMIELETGLVTRAKTEGVVEIGIEGFPIKIIVSELLYIKKQ